MKNKLIKVYNEKYFRNFQDTVLLPISKKTDDKTLQTLISIANEYDRETYCILHDLWELLYGSYPNTFIPLSKVANEIVKQRSDMLTKFYHVYSEIHDTNPILNEVVRLLQYSNNSCLVGGAVRDCVLGKIPKDFDFVTDIDLDTLEHLFSRAGYKVQSEGKQFLVLIVSKAGQQFEIAQFRKDKSNNGGEPGTIEEDAQRRDFGIGTGYIRLQQGNMELLDPSGQFVDDMKDNIIRFVGKAEDRLNEDCIRGWRFYRFIKRGFEPNKKCLKAVRQLWDGIYKNSNSERVRLEIEKMVGI